MGKVSLNIKVTQKSQHFSWRLDYEKFYRKSGAHQFSANWIAAKWKVSVGTLIEDTKAELTEKHRNNTRE